MDDRSKSESLQNERAKMTQKRQQQDEVASRERLAIGEASGIASAPASEFRGRASRSMRSRQSVSRERDFYAETLVLSSRGK